MKTTLCVLILVLSTPAFALCSDWTSSKVGKLDTNYVNEASGLAASKLKTEMLLWTNDSGAKEALYASSKDGRIARTVALKNFPNRDFEALSSGACPGQREEFCIFVADIGDNKLKKTIYRIGAFREKDFWTRDEIFPVSVTEFSYPEGSENAESLVVLPSGHFLIFTKSLTFPKVYVVSPTGKVELLRTLDMSTLAGLQGLPGLITDATLSPDGTKVLILTYTDLLEVTLRDLLLARPLVQNQNYKILKGPGLLQQETVTYTSDTSFITSTETETGGAADIFIYECKNDPKGDLYETR